MRGHPEDLTHRRFGRLTVLGPGPMTDERYPRRLWRCRCDCGGERLVAGTNLRQGQVSCGCHRAERCRLMGLRNGSQPRARKAANELLSAMRSWAAT